eukprot:Sdes_comp9178_c0_seq1m647
MSKNSSSLNPPFNSHNDDDDELAEHEGNTSELSEVKLDDPQDEKSFEDNSNNSQTISEEVFISAPSLLKTETENSTKTFGAIPSKEEAENSNDFSFPSALNISSDEFRVHLNNASETLQKLTQTSEPKHKNAFFPLEKQKSKSVDNLTTSQKDENLENYDHFNSPSTSSTLSKHQNSSKKRNFILPERILKSSHLWLEEQKLIKSKPLNKVTINSKSLLRVSVTVKASHMLVWTFATENYDISFGVTFKPDQPHLVDPHKQNSSQDEVSIPILPRFRCNSHKTPVVGCHTAICDGVYALSWDNTFSFVTSKTLYYRLTTKSFRSKESSSSSSFQG